MPSTFKKTVENLARGKAPGPSTTFSVFHFFLALELMAEKPVGCNNAAKNLGVGDGAGRTIIGRLKDADLIAITKEGCNLTEKGMSTWKDFESMFPKRLSIEKNELTASNHNYVLLVKDRGHRIKSGIEQRDAAIMGGARRAIVIVSKGDKLVIDSISNDVAKEFPNASIQIVKAFTPKDNDVIVIAGADDSLKAKRGAFAASWILIAQR